jgi:hypothetical protein
MSVNTAFTSTDHSHSASGWASMAARRIGILAQDPAMSGLFIFNLVYKSVK